jgi:Alpha/beta hydrolase domain
MKKRLGHVVLMLPFVVITLFALMVALGSEPAEARLTRITAGPATFIDLPAFGDTGPYLKIAGTFEGEIDPSDRRNAVIADIDLAPTTAGKVRYSSTFFILRPADLSKGNGKIFYDFGNRGNKRILEWFNDGTASNDPATAEHFGNGFLMRKGYIVALSGYAGDVTPGANVLSVNIPVAVNPDGSSITGPVVAELVAGSASATTINLPYEASNTSAANGVLTVREHGTDPKVEVSGWSYINSRRISFPGPAKPQWIYEFVYEAKDPMVMGIGHAITRDFISFLKHETADDFGNANPVAMPGGIRAIYSWGRSNGGRNQRDLLLWGFNEDENGRIVIDGMMPYATGSGGSVWMNFRFAQPTSSSRKHERHFAHEPEFPFTFPVMTDPLTGQTGGILQRCLASHTCPKFFNIDGGNEYWNKSSSLNHTDAFGNDLNIEKLAPNVRLYSIASIEHNTTFDQRPEFLAECQQMTNPLYNGPIFRALSVALDH